MSRHHLSVSGSVQPSTHLFQSHRSIANISRVFERTLPIPSASRWLGDSVDSTGLYLEFGRLQCSHRKVRERYIVLLPRNAFGLTSFYAQ